MINLLEQAITATTRTERPGSFETRRRRTRCRARLVTDPRLRRPLGKSKQRAGYFSQRPAHGQ